MSYVTPFFFKGIMPDPAKADEWIAQSFDVVCPVYEKRLAEHGKRYLAGDKLSIADFKCFAHFISFGDSNKATILAPETLEKINACTAKYPNVSRWIANMKGELGDYIANRRVPTPI